MRIIKFRAWNKSAKKMFDPHKITPLALNNDCAEIEGVFLPFREDVELMQFTGLLDKQGKEIYEGDIVRLDGNPYEVFWDSDFTGFSMSFTGEECLGLGEQVIGESREVEIIGNIYESPELLEVGQ